MRCCEADIGRCPCIHGRFQATDIILQSILYQRAIVPALVKQILFRPETSQEIKFVENFNKIRGALRDVFRSHNRSSIREVVFLVGNSCLLPKELYCVQVDLCGIDDSESCHRNCSELTEKELRKVSSSILLNLMAEDSSQARLQGSQVYVFLRGRSSLQFPEDLIEEDDGFEFPSDDVIERKKIMAFRVVLKHHCHVDGKAAEASQESAEDLTWFRVCSSLRRFVA